MSTYMNEDAVCPRCGGNYWEELNLRTGNYRRVTMCKCDMKVFKLENRIKELKKTKRHNEKKIKVLLSLIDDMFEFTPEDERDMWDRQIKKAEGL